jgi:hypothetical protein
VFEETDKSMAILRTLYVQKCSFYYATHVLKSNDRNFNTVCFYLICKGSSLMWSLIMLSFN